MASQVRQSPLSYEWLWAEVATFPVCSEYSFAENCRVISLDLRKCKSTQRLWAAAERHLLENFGGLSIEELVSIRDATWYNHSGNRASNITTAFRNFADDATNGFSSRFNKPRSGSSDPPRLSQPPREGRDRLWWALSCVPEDLLAATTAAGTLTTRSPSLVARLEERGFAETHLHLGAALDFPRLWLGTLLKVSATSCSEGQFVGPAASFGEGRRFARWIAYAFIVRQLLMYHFEQLESGSTATFTQSVARYVSLASSCSEEISNLLVAQEARKSLIAGLVVEGHSAWRSLQYRLRSLLQIVDEAKFVGTQSEDTDPGRHFLLSEGGSDVENRLCRSFFQNETRFAKDSSDWGEIEGLFWQYQRVRNIFYRHIVVRPRRPGLLWFVRHYSRLASVNVPINLPERLSIAAEVSGAKHGLRSLEVRSTSSESFAATFSYLSLMYESVGKLQETSWASHRNGEGPIEFGLVLHLNRDRGGGFRRGAPAAFANDTREAPGQEANRSHVAGLGFRFLDYYGSVRRTAESAGAVIESFPLCAELVCGFDVCSDESGVPIWLARSYLRPLVTAHESARVYLGSKGDGIGRAGLTAHAGEDFVHVLSGLRRIDQSIEALGLQEGDRLGHCLALGVDTETWATQTGQVTIRAEERFWDLCWEYTLVSAGKLHGGFDRAAWLDQEIVKLGNYLFNGTTLGSVREGPMASHHRHQNLSRQILLDFYNEVLSGRIVDMLYPLAHDPYMFEAIYRDLAELDNPVGKLVMVYLTRPDVFERSMTPIRVDTSSDGVFLSSVQHYLVEKVARLGLTVEVNPASNLLVGDFADLQSHPLWRIKPIHNRESSPVPVCIGSDDPILFSSSLVDEYQRLADAMHRAGVAEEQISGWIERSRGTGLYRRFTRGQLSHSKMDAITRDVSRSP